MSESTRRDIDPETVVVESGSGDPGALATGNLSSLIGTSLGRYLVIEELGRGGMGVVLRAYDPKLQREVALKLVRTDRLGTSEERRLIREARAMARLAHPNVVAVYDVETDEAGGRVVVVMEYVAGQTLRQWLDEEPRSPAQILAAFLAAGRGLAAAHAEQLLHRDFKPDNVLVGATSQPTGMGRVRVTDFGLARASVYGTLGDRDEADASTEAEPDPGSSNAESDSSGPPLRADGVSDALTAAGTVMGTPIYMAPEQAAAEDMDASVDQYAFCVALWRALAGRWPFEGRDYDKLQVAKRAGPPRWPEGVAVSAHIGAALRRGLAVDPADRWPTLLDLLAELERVPGRRMRRVLAVGSIGVIGLSAAGWERWQRADALGECEQRASAIDEAYGEARADRIAAAFAQTDVSYADDTWQRARKRLDTYAKQWSLARERVCIAATVQRTMDEEVATLASACLDDQRADLDAFLGELETPDRLVVMRAASATASLPPLGPCEDPSRLRLRPRPPEDPAQAEQVASLKRKLSQARAAHTLGRYEEAREVSRAVVEQAQLLGWAPLVGDAKLALANGHTALASYDEAVALLEQVFFDAAAVGRDGLALSAASALSFVVGRGLGRHDKGLEWGRLARTFAARQGLEQGADDAQVLSNLAAVHNGAGNYERAEELAHQALSIWEEVLGPEHPQVAMALNNLALDLHNQGEYEQAKPLEERALAIWEASLGPGHPHTAMALNNLGNTVHSQGDYASAQRLHERALAVREAALGPEHPAVAASLANLGNALYLQDKSDDARKVFERALSIWEASLGPEHPDLVGILSNIGIVLASQGALDRARALFERSIALGESTLGPDHPEVARPLYQLGHLFLQSSEPQRAVPLLERSLATFEAEYGDHHPDVASSQFMLARALWESGSDSGGDRRRALTLARDAADSYRQEGEPAARDLADVEAWLQAHRVDPSE